MNIRIIGYGRLAKALAEQWCSTHRVIVSSPSQIQGVLENGIETSDDNLQSLSEADIIFLAVKPALINQVMQEIASILTPDCLVVSLAAGVTLSHLQSLLPGPTILRAMPNINAQVKASATVLLKNHPLNPQQQDLVETLFLSIGTVDWVAHDDELDIGTILAGSGPAYVFYLMQVFESSAVQFGLPRDLAKKLIVQTFLGSTLLAKIQDSSFENLIDQVVSPQGTTAAALAILDKQRVPNSVHQAIQAAWQRVLQLRS